ncbi:hypothetical protein E1262_27510 [Jiangella aurantiaca]|uniref:Uncharacterized protein n=1 Tax=Jiangella aurantiaca TaxID=2530373 RepID=A0A4R5A291_9ACTN|nr:hypothetical protein [Jiangella aurantiaca]TDD64649.1 hypothetical protein E1262_27510 [Jiangella aurantiaca]
MSGYLFLAVLAGVVATAAIVAVVALILLGLHLRHALRTRRRRDFTTPAVFGYAALAAAGAIVLLHFVTVFFFVPGFTPTWDCPEPAQYEQRRLFPVSATCTRGAAVVTEYVPWWVNPVLGVLILGVVFGTVLALSQRRAGVESHHILRRRRTVR